jgi:hypothetical protein
MRVQHIAQELGQLVRQLAAGFVEQLEQDVDVLLVDTEVCSQVCGGRRHNG